MRIKKLQVLFISGALFVAVFGSGEASASFMDVPEYNLFDTAVSYLEDSGIVVGYSDGTYGVDKNINRAEFLKIVMEAGDYDTGGSDCYPDVKNDWYAPYVCKATELKLVEGYPDGYFRPEQEINFAEASKIITNTLYDLLGEQARQMLEIAGPTGAAGETWYGPFVYALELGSAIPGDVDSFDKKVTRGEMAEIAWRVMTETTYKISNTYENIKEGKVAAELGAELVNFDSCAELNTYFNNNSTYNRYGGFPDDVMMPMEESQSDAAPPGTGASSPKATMNEAEASAGVAEHSQTNVQVSGVDEADIVKNDSRYIYYLKDSTVRIIDAYPASRMKELDSVTFSDSGFYPQEMYVDDDRLIVIGNSYDASFGGYTGGSGIRYDFYGSATKMYIFDISDKTDVSLMRETAFEGYYSSSRKIGDVVYLVVDQYTYFVPTEGGGVLKNEDLVPLYSDNNKVAATASCGDVKYVPGIMDSTNYMIIAAVPTDSASKAITREVVVGGTGTIYASTDNLYVTEPKYHYSAWYDESGESEETYIHKFALDGLNVSYEGVGAVPGTILNQFSMDESGDYFRIATTKGGWWTNATTNNVYVLDSGLDVVGKLEGLAPGESIYSVRFVGNRAYLVTFEKIDPLFVIDLSNPVTPKILGQLKIAGVSDYLHPYDENHIIGFGLETISPDEAEELGWSWFQGVKISMFDVTDVNHPVELHKEVIGDRGSYSELTYNHKALLFDKDKGIMAFPVTVAAIPQAVKDNLDVDQWVYGDYVFQGAYVYDVSIENGFELRGTISHYDDSELGNDFSYYYNYGDNKSIARILYIGSSFYTVSPYEVQANNMTSMNKEASVVLAE
ncbi:MAG: beta-propeller domain-containing protein [Candidatus Peregrinibacteria bacterium]